MKKKGIDKLNFWKQKVSYTAPRSAQRILNPGKTKVVAFAMSAESYDSCGDYDTGCADGGDGGDDG